MSIFSDDNKITGNWVKFTVVGDKCEGTLLEVRQAINKLSGLNQNIYELKSPEGDILLVGGKPAIDAQMKHVKLGQIVGLEFIREDAPKVTGHNPTKIIQVYANKDVVDQDYLNAKEAETALGGTAVDNMPSEEEGIPDFSKEAELLEKIRTIAKAKYGLETETDISKKVMEETKLAFIEDNFAAILEQLEK